MQSQSNSMFEDFDILSALIREAEALPPNFQKNMPPSNAAPSKKSPAVPPVPPAPVIFNPDLLADDVPEDAVEFPPEEAERLMESVEFFVDPSSESSTDGRP